MRLPHALVALCGAVAIAGWPAPAGALPASAVALPASAVDDARSLELADDAAGAAALLRPYVAQHPDDAAAGLLLGDLEFRLPDVARAEAAWHGVLAAHPRNAAAHARLGGLYAALGRPGEAADQYAADMPSPAAAAGLVAAHARLGDLAWFARATADLADQNRFDAGYVMMEALVLEAERLPAAAIGYFDRAVGLGRGRCADRIARANDELELQRTGDAIDDLRRCLAIEPGNDRAMALLGTAYLMRKQPELARGWLDRALAIDPAGFEALVDRGAIEEAAGAWQAAMRDDQAAIAADPMRGEGYANFAADLLDRGALSSAEATIGAGLRALPGYGRLHYLLARAYEREGRPPAAVRAEYVAALGSDETVVVRAAGDALRVLGYPR